MFMDSEKTIRLVSFKNFSEKNFEKLLQNEKNCVIVTNTGIFVVKIILWGYSSAGRALEWHSRGQRFDPAYLHHNKPASNRRFPVL